ncbi:DUF6572 domain-containing protein [Sphingomonas kyeonggiensis]|uniref:Uncharacterized protein n=1 Tax=Sphingomonas kyeonggiensis TaxID=1268553 RepID=A0A7W6NWG9_9SPHN|nr:DUF6572 domain-containing protein [Sphingomonas kyeonggiensis]MBB4097478.1 hypothetical protein [Sphingomonas kyeonggiensis]MBB4097479.1 hypothetical protein [Sphingomonas kyeonggiensis]
MSIVDAGTIDAIGIDKVSGDVVLNISDHLDWCEEASHLKALEDKVNAYLGYLESGQIVEDVPEAKGRRPVIAVHQQFVPTETAKLVLERLQVALDSHGIGFTFGALPAGY